MKIIIVLLVFILTAFGSFSQKDTSVVELDFVISDTLKISPVHINNKRTVLVSFDLSNEYAFYDVYKDARKNLKRIETIQQEVLTNLHFSNIDSLMFLRLYGNSNIVTILKNSKNIDFFACKTTLAKLYISSDKKIDLSRNSIKDIYLASDNYCKIDLKLLDALGCEKLSIDDLVKPIFRSKSSKIDTVCINSSTKINRFRIVSRFINADNFEFLVKNFETPTYSKFYVPTFDWLEKKWK